MRVIGERLMDSLPLVRTRPSWEKPRDHHPSKEAAETNRPYDMFKVGGVPPFQFDEVPRAIGDLARAFSAASGFDPSGVIVAAVVAAASMIDEPYVLEVSARSDWRVSARFWAVLCGPSGAGKTSTITKVTRAIEKLHREHRGILMLTRETGLKAQPWFQFWRILRNCFAHDMRFNFNSSERALLPITWSGVTIDLSLDGKPLTHGQCSRDKMRELVESARVFIERDLTQTFLANA